MEDILILIIQGIIEFLFELFGYLPWDLWWYARPKEGDESDFGFGVWLFSSVILGGTLGYISVFVFPNVIIKFGWLRIALLFLSPLASGFFARQMALHREERGRISDSETHFWLSFCFSMGLVWMRFAFAHRP